MGGRRIFYDRSRKCQPSFVYCVDTRDAAQAQYPRHPPVDVTLRNKSGEGFGDGWITRRSCPSKKGSDDRSFARRSLKNINRGRRCKDYLVLSFDIQQRSIDGRPAFAFLCAGAVSVDSAHLILFRRRNSLLHPSPFFFSNYASL